LKLGAASIVQEAPPNVAVAPTVEQIGNAEKS
jgi:hypothetical protein